MQVSKDQETFEVPRNVATMSHLITGILDDEDPDDEAPEIPLPNVSGEVLTKVIEFCQHNQVEEMTPIQTPLKSNKLEDLVQPWYASFVKVDKNMLFDLVAAANYLDIRPLLDLTCLAVSILIKGKSAAELRQMFNISEEFTPEEQAQIQRENQWAEQPPSNNQNNSE
jgi:S-phase kinase-associated protein 1